MIHVPIGTLTMRTRVTCPTCAGRGTTRDDRALCPTCDGERVVVAPNTGD